MLDQTIKETERVDAEIAAGMLESDRGYESIKTEEGFMVIHECRVVLRYNEKAKILMLDSQHLIIE
jgi:hypothetical protein